MNPYANPVLLARVKEIGEVRFNAERLAEAKEWIRSHPGKFAQLTLERIWLYWMPEGMRPAQTWLLRMLSLVGFAGMFLAFRRPPPAIRICGIALLTYPVPYYIVGASPRYELPLWPVILLFAGLFVVTMADRARAQVTARRPPLVTSSSL